LPAARSPPPTTSASVRRRSPSARRCSSLAALKSNVTRFRLKDRSRTFKRDALPFAAALGTGAYDLAFADPPYESRMLDRVIDHWRATAFAPVLAVEHARTHPLPPGSVTKVFGDTAVTIYRAPRAISG